MTIDRLDGLGDWREVREELEELKGLNLSDRHHNLVRRILNHRGSWRAKECVLESIRAMKDPSNEVIQDVCSIMCDEDAPPELRLMAVHIIRDTVVRRKNEAEPVPHYYRGVTVVDKLKELVGTPMHPILQKRVVRALEEIDRAETKAV